MTALASFVSLFVLAGLFALADWYAVATGLRRLRWLAKPAVMVALIAAASLLEPRDATVRAWFVVALVLSLVGDVALLLPRERFVAGLAAFLLAHLAYIVGLGLRASAPAVGLVGLLVVGAVLASLGRRVFGAVRSDHSKLLLPVAAYMAVISAMVVAAFATGSPTAIAGATLFYASDANLAWNRFVAQRRWGGLATIVTYHLGQALLVLSLVG